ncbi:MAG TPA: SurA N-terminal domain-containing protein [Pyrinomonadaceae bacterium]|nr:SurA N-terminal domain-containing protein [Pyrinomonadaceae bacterium]
MRKIAIVVFPITLALAAVVFSACSPAGSDAKESMVAATVNGKNIMLAEVERTVSQQAGGKQSSLSQLELAQARLQVLGSLIQREVLFQRAEREKLLPTEEQITAAINQQKQQSGMTDEDFNKSLSAQNMSMETLREEARKDLAVRSLQDKYSGKISISDKEVEDFYNNNRQQFISARGAALAVIIVDPADNSEQGIQNDAKNEAEAKLKIDNVYQQLKGGADFATVARSKSEDAQSLVKGGDIGFFSEDGLKQAGLPKELSDMFMGPMQVGSFTEPKQVNNRWYIFKLEEKRLQTENLTLESPGVRQQITQALINQRKDILNAALLEVAVNEAKVVNNLAANMLNNPGNLGLRPASPGSVASPSATQQSTATPQPAASPAASTAAGPKGSASPK